MSDLLYRPDRRGVAWRVSPVLDHPPPGFDALRAEAMQEGHRSLDRLLIEWTSGKTRFDAAGEALLAVHVGDDLAGIGGMTRDPFLAGALRMRRFYVGRDHRCRGIGRALASALLTSAGTARPITVNAGTADAAAFWETLGFQPIAGHGHTHHLPARSPISVLEA